MNDDTGANEVGPAPATAERLGVFGAYFDRRIAVMLALGFASGLPNLLIYDTLSAWLRQSDVSLTTISFFSLVGLSYSFKFLWAPLVDRTSIPVLTAWIGHRRSWMLVAQALIMLGLLAVSGGNPRTGLIALAICAALTGFAAATQDIVIDAWRIEVSEQARQGAMAAAYQAGFRIAIIVAGAAPLVLADHIGWHITYGLMAALMLIGVAGVFGAPREAIHRLRAFPDAGLKESPILEVVEWIVRLAILSFGAIVIGSALGANATILGKILEAAGAPALGANLVVAWAAKPNGVWLQLAGVIVGFGIVVVAACPIPRMPTRPGAYLFHAFGDPLGDFFGRFGVQTASLILALICVYRLSDFVLNIMTPFYQDLGFTLTQVAEARKVFGVVASLVGVFIGGLSVARLGLMRSMVIGAFALPITNTIFAWLATQGPDFRSLLFAIGIDNIVSGYAGTCLIAYMSSLTSAGFTATQYALFSSLYSLPGKLVASQSGRVVESAARAADHGGLVGALKGFFAHSPPTAFAHAMQKSHVAPASLGAGYMVFFFYSGLVGVLSMILAVIVARRTKAAATPDLEGPAPQG
jgi:PAT family beta-lactamase induction signal transducer AmpG